jgi:hypothetical protein
MNMVFTRTELFIVKDVTYWLGEVLDSALPPDDRQEVSELHDEVHDVITQSGLLLVWPQSKWTVESK